MKTAYTFVRGKPLFWLAVGVVSSLILAVTEIVFAKSIEILIVSVGLGDMVPGKMLIVSPDGLGPWQLAALLCGVGATRSLFLFLTASSSHVSELILSARLRQICLHEMLLNRQQTFVSASLVNFRFADLFPKTSYFINLSMAVLVNSLMCFGLLAGLFWVDIELAAVALAGILIIGAIVFLLNIGVRRVSKAQIPATRSLNLGVQRIARNWMLVRALRTERREYGILADLNIKATSHGLQATLRAIFGATLPSVLGMVLLCALVIIQMNRVESSGLNFIFFLYILIRLVQSLSTVASSFGIASAHYPIFREAMIYVGSRPLDEINEAIGPTQSITTLWQRRVAKGADPVNVNDTTPIIDSSPRPPKIEVRNISFAYTDHAQVLNSLDIDVSPGELWGLVGSSGTGKSTFLAIILGLIKPNQGDVKLDDMDPAAYFRLSGKTIGYVGAEPFLLEGSIKDNLDYGSSRAYSKAEYDQALAQAHLLDVVRLKKDGLLHHIDESGAGLSAGEKQRLSLARALLRKPQLLILDEISANLDAATEADVADTLLGLKGTCTCIVVSHRAGVLRHADRIFELQRQTYIDISEIGTTAA